MAVDVVEAEGERLVVVASHRHHASAVQTHTVELGSRDAIGDDHHAVLDAQLLSRIGYRDGMVARGDGTHAATQLRRCQLRHGVHGTTDLEAPAQLLALELEAIAMVLVTQVEGIIERRAPHTVLDALVGFAYIVSGKVTCHGLPLSGMSLWQLRYLYFPQ